MPVSTSQQSPPEVTADTTLAWRCINTIRTLAMDAVQRANSGHPGTPMALAPAAWVLWTRFLRFNPRNPEWPDRDRFILSNGHASMLLYALLHLTGYDLSLEEIRNFRQWGSRTPGHPERGHTPGVEVTTGPLGQGIANSVGMAIAERILGDHFNRPDQEIVGHRIWGFVSDGDLMEGIGSEAASVAGFLRLGTINLIYDDNHITIDGHTEITFREDVGQRFEAYGWHVLHVEDGNDLEAITRALEAARDETDRPTLIVLRTIIGDPAPTKRDTPEAHGAPLGEEEIRRTKEIMGWTEPPFSVPDEVARFMGQAVSRGRALEEDWQARFEAYRGEFPAEAAEFESWMAGDLPRDWDRGLPTFTPADGPLATRQASQKVLNALMPAIPNLVGGSADLAGSTGTVLKDFGEMGPESTGRVIHWGVREHVMGSASNGIAAHGGLRPFGATFFIFFDYMKPAVRLAALSRLPVIFIGTHDSIGLGEDGPTHQPIEQLAMLRATPNTVVFRPADAIETVEGWRAALQRTDGPTALVLTRQKLPVLPREGAESTEGARRGGYILSEPVTAPRAVVIATGSEVHVALAAAEALGKEDIPVRVVSLPSWELFEAQDQEYRDRVLPPDLTARVTIEAASGFGWERYAGDKGAIIAMHRFGASAPAKRLFQEFGFTAEAVATAVRRVLKGEHHA